MLHTEALNGVPDSVTALFAFATKRAEEAEAETRRWFEAFNALEREQVKRELVDAYTGRTYTEDQVSEIVRTYQDQFSIIDDYHDREIRIREAVKFPIFDVHGTIANIRTILDQPAVLIAPRNPL